MSFCVWLAEVTIRSSTFLSKPGLWMQNMTTKEPDDSMIEVGIASVEAVFDWKTYLKETFRTSIRKAAYDAAELIAQAAKRLSDAGVPEPELDAKILFLEAFHMDQVHFLMNRMRPLTEEQRAQQETYEVMIDRRSARVPLQHDSGQPGIYGADLPRGHRMC